MNDTSLPTPCPAPDDPRLTALALGEITDPAEARALREAIGADPASQREFDAIRALATALQTEFRAEAQPARPAASNSLPFADAQKARPARRRADTAPEEPAHRRRHGSARSSGFGPRLTPRASLPEKIIRFTILGGLGIGAAATLIFSSRLADTAVNKTEETTVATAPEYWVKLRPKKPAAILPEGHPIPAPAAGALPVSKENGLAELVATLPVRIPGSRENIFMPARGRAASLCLTSAGKNYARRLQSSLIKGTLPPRRLMRIDGLVNAFLSDTRSATEHGVQLVAEAVPAPWASGHWLVRATVRAGEIGGSIVGTGAHATVAFSPEQVDSWRMLGCEDGDTNAATLEVPGVMRGGESLTTLFELVPAADAREGEAIGMVRITYRTPEGQVMTLLKKVAWPAPGGLETALEDTRFAAAVASFGLAMRQSQYRGAATLGMAGRLAESAKEHPNKKWFDAMVRDAAPLVGN
ncbi:MAG: DUF3520 domain-containing protein [Puniceicoccales bacterium]|jgi:hypothetical protein|nr:DUF3520 domain-containing protein [Puniceicoccales bacterium]